MIIPAKLKRCSTGAEDGKTALCYTKSLTSGYLFNIFPHPSFYHPETAVLHGHTYVLFFFRYRLVKIKMNISVVSAAGCDASVSAESANANQASSSSSVSNSLFTDWTDAFGKGG